MLAKEYLLNIPMWTKKKNSLEDVEKFLAELGHPETAFSIIHVAGTNGKGSVCADLTAVLKAAGYRVGTFVSPHLEDIRERFLLNGEMIGEGEFQQCFEKVQPVVESMQQSGFCHPTFFEYCFLLALVWFADRQVDYCILETGLGGRLDTTNVVKHPLACVITSISLDHMQYLGSTVAEIALEKAGIIKPGVPLIFDGNSKEAAEVLIQKAKELHAPACSVTMQDAELLVPEKEAFAAPYQVMNAALAVKTLESLNIPGVNPDTYVKGFQSVYWPGRMEQVSPGVYLDGAHNPGGIQAFIEAVKTQLAGTEHTDIYLLFAAVSDKDYKEMIHMLCRELPVRGVTVAQLHSERAADQQKLAQLFLQAGCPFVEQFTEVRPALASAWKRKGSGRLYIVGSLYLIGEIKQILREIGEQEVHND